MYPNSARQPSSGTDIYIRNKIVQPLPPGVSSLTQNIDTVQYQNYVSSGKQVGGNMNNLKIDSVQKAKLEQMQTKLQLLANKIVNLNGKLNLTDIKVTSQSAIDSLELGKYLVQYKITDAKLDSYNSDVNTNVQNILNDSDIIVLQQNYKYMFWTTLAVGTVLLSMNIV
jgi:Ser-tRNA(Ala) deacylase AlaX